MTHTRSAVLFILLILLLQVNAAGTHPISIEFNAIYSGKNLVLGDTCQTGNDDKVVFDILKFYVSSIKLFNKNEMVLEENNSYHLIDFSSFNKIILDLPDKILFDRIEFNLGIDSVTNSAGAMGDDLDPTKGMYWTWQSGYINFKLEGYRSFRMGHNKTFQFHLGGYSYPNNSMKLISLKANGNSSTIIFDVEKFMEGIEYEKTENIMSPGSEAMRLSKIASGCFRTKTK